MPNSLEMSVGYAKTVTSSHFAKNALLVFEVQEGPEHYVLPGDLPSP